MTFYVTMKREGKDTQKFPETPANMVQMQIYDILGIKIPLPILEQISSLDAHMEMPYIVIKNNDNDKGLMVELESIIGNPGNPIDFYRAGYWQVTMRRTDEHRFVHMQAETNDVVATLEWMLKCLNEGINNA